MELVKQHARALVLSLPAHGNAIAFAPLADANAQHSPLLRTFKPGQRVTCVAGAPAATSGDSNAAGMRGRLLLHLEPLAQDVAANGAVKPKARGVGEVGTGVVKAVHATHADVQLGKRTGRLHVCELRDWNTDELASVRSLCRQCACTRLPSAVHLCCTLLRVC